MILGIVGMTATGKTEIVKTLINKFGIKKIVTTTTRPQRLGEIPGFDYNFISDEEFENKKSNNYFFETTQYNTVSGIWKYGTPFNELKKDGAIILNPDGLRKIREANIDCFIVHIKTPENIIRERLENRGDFIDEVNRRIETDKIDFANIDNLVDYEIINDGLKSIDCISHIIYDLYIKNSPKNTMNNI